VYLLRVRARLINLNQRDATRRRDFCEIKERKHFSVLALFASRIDFD